VAVSCCAISIAAADAELFGYAAGLTAQRRAAEPAGLARPTAFLKRLGSSRSARI
jgi:transcriptional regulator of acetoin/glycerol metabolism